MIKLNLEQKLIKVYNEWTTRKLGKVFEEYAKSIGLRKWDGRRNDNSNTYFAEGKDEGWDRVICQVHDPIDSSKQVQIVLRKYTYFLIQRGNKRIFEYDYKKGTVDYDEEQLNKVINTHENLFDMLFK